ncbi:MAG: hypothetical protein AVDCRST_MAG68-724 [uncultured Gemmatimonadetes bacterium]|uniref:Blue (type 1) copper domain-containing protein n=1 Tax=uncultured Gemmatimonadota bacterium TaxID=203437 RepID=A0A6J4KFS4_9BACT|nr:MAG: hypothetical protein AVDCRST_MAG68-724 [uncultured Gemmatimonadota bacterium]
MRNSHGVLAIAAILALAACGGGGDSGTNPDPDPPVVAPAGPTVTAGANSDVFSPSDMSIKVGETVTWTFGPRPHNVVFGATPGAPSSIGVTSNAQVSRTFTAEGTFPYDCTIHPGMRGRVVVGSTAGNTPPPGY